MASKRRKKDDCVADSSSKINHHIRIIKNPSLPSVFHSDFDNFDQNTASGACSLNFFIAHLVAKNAIWFEKKPFTFNKGHLDGR